MRLEHKKALILGQLKMYMQEAGEIEQGKMAEDAVRLIMDFDYDVEQIAADYDKEVVSDTEDVSEATMERWKKENWEQDMEYMKSKGVR